MPHVRTAHPPSKHGDKGIATATAHDNPAQTVHAQEKIRHDNQDIRIFRHAQPGIASRGAGAQLGERAGKVGQPFMIRVSKEVSAKRVR